jgi:hypothetical protein
VLTSVIVTEVNPGSPDQLTCVHSFRERKRKLFKNRSRCALLSIFGIPIKVGWNPKPIPSSRPTTSAPENFENLSNQ